MRDNGQRQQGAVEDLAPDEAFIVTTVGFTKPAIKYAAAKGIRLALLRPPEGDDDWANLVREINVSMQYSVPVQEPQVEWMVPDDQPEVLAAWSGGGLVSAESVEIVHADGTMDTVHSLAAKYVRVPASGTAGIAVGEETFSDRSVLRVAGQPDLQVTGFKWQQRFEVAVHQFTVGDGIGGLTSELMLRTLDGSVHKMFSNRDLAAWTLDASGRVVPKLCSCRTDGQFVRAPAERGPSSLIV